MFAFLLIASIIGCTTHVSARSTSATDQVSIYKGPMPIEGGIYPGDLVATGEGITAGKTPYVIGRRFWAVAENDQGMSVVRIKNQAKIGPIFSCIAGFVFPGPWGWGCLYVSGPSSNLTHIQSPE